MRWLLRGRHVTLSPSCVARARRVSPSMPGSPLDIVAIARRLADHRPRDVGDDAMSRAAVATVLREFEGDVQVLLIRRAEDPRDPWSGHMAFPGGRRDPGDPDLLATARREAQEEVGLDLDASARVLGRLDDLEAVARGRRTGLVIRPFVFALTTSAPPFSPNYEVAEVLWAPLQPMLEGLVDTTRPYEHGGMRFDLPAFDVDGRVVWGLTYQMLQAFFVLLR